MATIENESQTIKIALRTRPTQHFANKNIKLELAENVF